MAKRWQQNREYSDCKKTASPACCSLYCCGNRFGGHSGRVKRMTRRYHRHAIKVRIKLEIQSDMSTIEQDWRDE